MWVGAPPEGPGRDRGALLAKPPAALAGLDIQMQVIVMGGIGAGAKNRGEMQAGRGAGGSLERFEEIAAVLSRLDAHTGAIVKAKGGDVEGVAKGVL